MAQNITQIPAARVPLVDPESGLVNRDWYRFLANIYLLAGQGSNPTTLDELQLVPAPKDGIAYPVVVTVAGLTSAAKAGMGAKAFVTDATQSLTAGIGAAVVGGGANKVPVVSDGTTWRIG